MLKEIVLPPIDMKKFSDQPIDSNLIIMSHDFNVNELVIPFYEGNGFDTYEAFYTFQGNTSIIIQEVTNQHNEIRIPIVNDVRRHKGIFTIELNASGGSSQATLLKLNVMVKRSNIDSNSEFLFNHYYKLFEDYEKEIADLNNATQTTIKTQLKQSQDNLQKVTKTLIAINDKVTIVNDTADGFMTDVATKQIDVTSKYNAFDTMVNDTADTFTADVATKQADVTSKYNAFDTSVTTANQTIDDILGLVDDVQEVSAQVAEKANKTQEAWITPILLNGITADASRPPRFYKDNFGVVHLTGVAQNVPTDVKHFDFPVGYRPRRALEFIVPKGRTFSTQYAKVNIAYGWGAGAISAVLTSTDSIVYDGISFKAEG